MNYWDKRVEIFGPEKAFQPLTQKEACSEDSVAFSFGVVRAMLKVENGKAVFVTDSSGRSIIFGDPSRQDKTKYTTMSMARVVWYVFHAIMENEETQKKGVVFVMYPHKAKISQFNRELTKHITSSVKGCLPGTCFGGGRSCLL